VEGVRGLIGEKGWVEEDWKDRHNWRKMDNIINKLAQKDVNRLYSVLNNNNNNNRIEFI
jgi:hypothetical protein